jgi:hypothetical protein
MPEQDFGLLSDTGRELYVADAINDLTRLRLQLASATLAGIADRPEWGGIAASLRALGEDHPATVVDAFAEVLKAVGEEAHAGEDHEFLAYGIDTVDMLLRAGDEFDSARLKGFVERIHAFAADRELEVPEIPEAVLAGQLPKPASRSPFATSLKGFDLPPIDPPSWDLESFAIPAEEVGEEISEGIAKEAKAVASGEESHAAAPGEAEAEAEAEVMPVAELPIEAPETPAYEGASVVEEASAVENDPKKIVNFGPLFDPKLPFNLNPSSTQVVEPVSNVEHSPAGEVVAVPDAAPPIAPPRVAPSQSDPVAELASAFDSIPAATADRSGRAAGVANLAALAQGALWLAECMRPVTGAGAAVMATAVDGVRRDALAALAVDHVVSAAGARQRIQVGEQTRLFLRRLQNEVGSFDSFTIDAQWCRIQLSEPAAGIAERLGLVSTAPLAVCADGGRQIWVPVQAQRLTIWQSVADDGTICALPDLQAEAVADAVAWHALMIGPGGRPEVVAVAADVPMPPAAPFVRLGSGPVVLDPTRWKRLRSTCFVLGQPLTGIDWVAGAALTAGNSAVLLNPGKI